MVPVQRKSRSQTRKGRTHKGAKVRHSVQCPNCAGVKLPHAACEECGYVRPGLQLTTGTEV
ncbi:MAG: 50S ribosomal protein L32 [Phycisphaeraceae bacterium]|nr:50S ribosomal protein L32 [Phycisphaeraceae bacterium]